MINLQHYNIIPLGNDCGISHYLRKHDLRKHALPFDWTVTPIGSAITLLQNRFEHFLDEENIVAGTPCGRLLFDEEAGGLKISEEIITPVLCRKYNMLFPHDFPDKGLEELPQIKAKYQKRINRLFDVLYSSDTPVLFIAADNKLNGWQQEQYASHQVSYNNNEFKNWKVLLQALIEQQFNKLDYKIVDFEEVTEPQNSFKKKIQSLKQVFSIKK